MTSTILRGATTNFNSRPSARGDAAEEARDAWNAISIHAPPRGATSVFWHCALITYYFNSRPSARGDMRSENVLIPRSISIHAPPRGATNQPPRVTRIGIISIHAPPRGATWSFPPSRDYPTFQFTPLREGRLKTQEFHAMAAISIHAPPRGATGIRAVCTSSASAFQFTPLREGRPAGQSAMGNRNDFNSRPSARGDSPGRGYQLLINISIHAPPRGATTR